MKAKTTESKDNQERSNIDRLWWVDSWCSKMETTLLNKECYLKEAASVWCNFPYLSLPYKLCNWARKIKQEELKDTGAVPTELSVCPYPHTWTHTHTHTYTHTHTHTHTHICFS